MPPIQYPTRDPYASLRVGVQSDMSAIRGRDQLRTEVLPRLRSQFHKINATVFDGRLPMPHMEFVDDLGGAEAHCHSSRALAWSQPYTIRFLSRHRDDPARLTSYLAHEVAHLATIGGGGDEWYEEASHGTRFDAVHDAIKRGVRYQGERHVGGFPPGQSSRSSAPAIVHRGGKVRSRIKGSFFDANQRRGDQNLFVEKGQLVDASHWAVRSSPERFEAVPA